jgi:limonene-1,2-epoxide hydrolase
MSADPVAVVRAFVEAINSGSPDRVAEMMTVRHVFIDSDGTETSGRRAMAAAWRDYFSGVPDYRIIVSDALAEGKTVLLAGSAEGTFARDGLLKAANHWRVPAAWRAVVEGERIALWQVYVNPEPMAKALGKAGGS